ncbi:MAG: amidase [Actinomycetia bacterium]|nr:amidase [Actinomycetes bacterium]
MTLVALAQRLRDGETSPTEAVEYYLARIDALDGSINSYIAVMEDEAREAAAALEGSQPRGGLWGVPVAVKDVIDVSGSPTTAASDVRRDVAPADRDSAVVEGLRRAGAIILGKLNTHEFAYGAMTTSSRFGPSRNPWALDRIVGGSSGGSGACVAAELAAGTLGSDTAGSVRIPSCFNGVTGLRPTSGRISNRGVVSVAFSFDAIGPLARTAEDCALLLGAVAGFDPADASTVDVPVPDYTEGLEKGIEGLRVGVVRSLLGANVDGRIREAVCEAIDELAGLGARVEDVEVPMLKHFGTIQQAMQFGEATEVHLETLRTRLADYDPDVRARLLTGLFIPSPVYALGNRGRLLAYELTREAFREVDVLVAPTMPTLPPRIGEDTVDLNGEEILYRLTIIPFNSPWSLVGLPVLSVPCGFVDGLPAGLALVGWRFAEPTLFRAGHAFQQVTDWHSRRPQLEQHAGMVE